MQLGTPGLGHPAPDLLPLVRRERVVQHCTRATHWEHTLSACGSSFFSHHASGIAVDSHPALAASAASASTNHSRTAPGGITCSALSWAPKLTTARTNSSQGKTLIDKLEDMWTSRDFPVLVAVAKVLDRGDSRNIQASQVCEATGLSQVQVFAAFDALVPGYVGGKAADSMGGRQDVFFRGLTERGRRAVGLWPSGETVDALMEALRQAEASTDDPEEKGAIRRAAGALMGVGRDVMTDVMAAVISKQINGA